MPSTTYPTRSALMAMQQADPDGRDREPTEADYARFRRWAVDSFGHSALKAYYSDAWDEADPGR